MHFHIPQTTSRALLDTPYSNWNYTFIFKEYSTGNHRTVCNSMTQSSVKRFVMPFFSIARNDIVAGISHIIFLTEANFYHWKQVWSWGHGPTAIPCPIQIALARFITSLSESLQESIWGTGTFILFVLLLQVVSAVHGASSESSRIRTWQARPSSSSAWNLFSL